MNIVQAQPLRGLVERVFEAARYSAEEGARRESAARAEATWPPPGGRCADYGNRALLHRHIDDARLWLRPFVGGCGSRRYGPLTPHGTLDVTRMGPGS